MAKERGRDLMKWKEEWKTWSERQVLEWVSLDKNKDVKISEEHKKGQFTQIKNVFLLLVHYYYFLTCSSMYPSR